MPLRPLGVVVRRGRRRCLLVSTGTGLLLAVAGTAAPAQAAVSHSAHRAHHAHHRHAAATAPPVKTVIQGLVDRHGAPTAAQLGTIDAYVVAVNWSDLQPTAFGPIVADNAIDQAIARVRQPDFVAAGVTLKLRVLAGIDAPDWAKNLGGPPVPWEDNVPGETIPAGSTIGRFWTPEFGQAYDDLENKLAALYDSVPEIREVTVSRCSTIYDELFVRQLSDPNNLAALQAAGYTTAADEQCIQDAIAEHSVWQQTTSDVDFSPFPTLTDPTGDRDLGFTVSMMSWCRTELGIRCGLENNALSARKLNSPVFSQMYAAMTALGPPIELQTAALSRMGRAPDVFAAGTQIGANSIELPAGFATINKTVLASANQGLIANPLPPS